jgi:hypothetical protein
MAWENIEQRLTKAFPVKISFPAGTVWLPESHLTIDNWLTSIAETDEELTELNIPRIRFLQNRWRMEKLLQLRWENPPDLRSVWAMYVGTRAYILLFDGAEYQIIASIMPKDQPALYKAVLGRLLQNRSFIPGLPTAIKRQRPDLVPEAEIESLLYPEGEPESAGEWMRQDLQPREKRSVAYYLKKLLVGWVGNWVPLPTSWYWHGAEMDQEEPVEKEKRAA